MKLGRSENNRVNLYQSQCEVARLQREELFFRACIERKEERDHAGLGEKPGCLARQIDGCYVRPGSCHIAGNVKKRYYDIQGQGNSGQQSRNFHNV